MALSGPELEAAYRSHAPVCLGLAKQLLRDSQHAEDVVQQAFLEFWRHPERRDSARSNTRSWLLMLTHRRAVDRIRHEQTRRTQMLNADHDADHAGPDDRADTAERALEHVMGSEAVNLMGQLTDTQRQAIVLTFWGGYTQQEVARLTGAPLGTVKTRIRSALLQLRRLMNEPPGLTS